VAACVAACEVRDVDRATLAPNINAENARSLTAS